MSGERAMIRIGKWVAPFLLFISFIFSFPEDSPGDYLREPAVSGSFYPGNPEQLTALINGYFRGTPPVPLRKQNITGILAPHAGYIYSGKSAGVAYREIIGNSYDLVILLGPSHFVRIQRAAIILEGSFKTPLGNVRIDSETARKIYSRSPHLFTDSVVPFVKEHSLEVQLPFLQVALGDFSIVPIEVNISDERFLEQVAAAIYRGIKDKNVLVIASTDLSHYKPRDEAAALDTVFKESILTLDHHSLKKDLQGGRCEACGGAATVLALMVWKKIGAASVYIADYADSGDITGDTGSVVGYLSALVLRNESSGFHDRREKMRELELSGSSYLDEGERQQLLDIARKTIFEYVKKGKMPDIDVAGDKLRDPGAAFVTIEKGGKLRGCIGYTEAVYPLYRTVMECAVASSTEDPRFKPLTKEELEEIKIEISVLTPLKKIQDTSSIKVGRHGLMVSKGYHRGLLLPQVAVNNGWDLETFLSQTCVKAGLPPNEWKKGIDIYSFEAEVFSEEEYR